MVNLDKWEEITYDDIKKGDKIRSIVTQGNVVNDTKGIAETHSSWGGWYSKDQVKLLTHPEGFHPAGGGGRTIYRRKPKPFVFPEGLGAVVEATHRSGHKYLFVHSDPSDIHNSWTRGGDWHSESEILDRFTNPVILSKGFKVGDD